MSADIQRVDAQTVQQLSQALVVQCAVTHTQAPKKADAVVALETRLNTIMHSLVESQVHYRGFDDHRVPFARPADPETGIDGLVKAIATIKKAAYLAGICNVPKELGALIQEYTFPSCFPIPYLLEKTEKTCFRADSFFESEPFLAAAVRETGALSVRTNTCEWDFSVPLEQLRTRQVSVVAERFDQLLSRLPSPHAFSIRGTTYNLII